VLSDSETPVKLYIMCEWHLLGRSLVVCLVYVIIAPFMLHFLFHSYGPVADGAETVVGFVEKATYCKFLWK